MLTLWIDSLEFENRGGFIPDTQFVREMGQVYLLADGTGDPVRSAETAVSVSEPGRYRLLIRTKNWIEEMNPDGLMVSVDGEESGHICAEMHRQGWYWETAGEFQLDAGVHTVSVGDTTGWFGRFAAVILTSDPDFTPSPEVNAMLRQMAEIRGESREPEDLGDFDFAVVGGGAAGVVAAIAAARRGLSVALISDRPVLGGNGSEEGQVSMDGAAYKGEHETGVILEIKFVKERLDLTWSQAYEHVIGKEKNISLFKNLLADGADTEDNRIISISAVDTVKLKRCTLKADYFCDATGDAWLGYYAGASYHLGREGKNMYGESFAPELQDDNTMSGCTIRAMSDGSNTACGFISVNVGHAVTFRPPKWAYKLPEGSELGRTPGYLDRGNWWLEAPNDYDDLWETERVRDAMFRITLGYFDWMKNSWDGRDSVSEYELRGLGTFLAKRETRRLIGDYVMTQSDFDGGADFGDAVCYSGWNLDVHHVGGIFSGREGLFTLNREVNMTPIPYRCLYSKNINNLFMAGRCVSVSHIALGSTRVQMTCASMGQAVGMAAYLCGKYRTSPRNIGKEHIEELRRLLVRDDQYIPGAQSADAEDLAADAMISADSETENGKAANVVNGLTRPRDGGGYAWRSSGKLPQSLTLKLSEKRRLKEIRLTFDIPFDRYGYGFMKQPERDETVTDFTVDAKTDSGYKTIADIRDNYQRLAVIDAAGVESDEIRITVRKCVRSEYAVITEVRIY